MILIIKYCLVIIIQCLTAILISITARFNFVNMEHRIMKNKNDKVLIEFGKNLRAERNRAGLSQEGLAEKIGICAGNHIGTIERGETNPTLTTIVSIMKTLNISFEKLYDINEN